jgi:hypothetical protein
MPKILMLAIALVLTLGVVAQAQCPGGRCGRPVRSIVSPRPTLALPARKHTASPIKAKEHSIVARRGFGRGPGLWARITFRPGRR